MTDKIGCNVLCFLPGDRIVAVKAAKRPGIEIPGGKWEEGETLRQTAAREFREEIGAKCVLLDLLFQAHSLDGYYCYTFLGTYVGDHTGPYEPFLGNQTEAGEVVAATWEDLRTSRFHGYYDLLKEAWKKAGSPVPNCG